MDNTITFQQLVGHVCVYQDKLNLLILKNYHVLLGQLRHACNNNCKNFLPGMFKRTVYVPPFNIEFVVLFT